MAGAAAGGIIKKLKDEDEEETINDDLLNIFEKAFDVADMTQ